MGRDLRRKRRQNLGLFFVYPFFAPQLVRVCFSTAIVLVLWPFPIATALLLSPGSIKYFAPLFLQVCRSHVNLMHIWTTDFQTCEVWLNNGRKMLSQSLIKYPYGGK